MIVLLVQLSEVIMINDRLGLFTATGEGQLLEISEENPSLLL